MKTAPVLFSLIAVLLGLGVRTACAQTDNLGTLEEWLPAEESAGWRSGVDVTTEVATAVRGGARRGASLQGLVLVHTEWRQAVSADRVWQCQAYASTLTLAGQGPTERFADDLLALSNIEGFRSTRLYSWWGEARTGDWSIRLGALLADAEFAGTAVGGNFLNSAAGWPAFISANTVNTGPAFYAPALGVRVERSWGRGVALRLGIYDGDTLDSSAGDPGINRRGWHYRLGGDQKWFIIAESAFSPPASATRSKLGAWFHTAPFADVRDNTRHERLAVHGGNPRTHAGNYGVYAVFERTVRGRLGESGNIETHVRGGLSPSDRNTLGWVVDTGIAWTGPLTGRREDVAAIGIVHADFSGRFASQARLVDPTSPSPDYEQVIELTYRWKLPGQCELQPDLQYVRHPGGSASRPALVSLLLRFNASF